MTEQESTTTTERVCLSPSGQGVAVWVGDQVRLRLDWDKTRQLQVLLADALPEVTR